jgi:hypothetical protein
VVAAGSRTYSFPPTTPNISKVIIYVSRLSSSPLIQSLIDRFLVKVKVPGVHFVVLTMIAHLFPKQRINQRQLQTRTLAEKDYLKT